MAEQPSPKRQVGGSTPSAPASGKPEIGPDRDRKAEVKEKQMTSATPAFEEGRRDKAQIEAAAKPSLIHAYKPGEGYATRLGMMVVVMAYVAFACHHWFYNWVFLRDFVDNMFSAMSLGRLTSWSFDPTAGRIIAGFGAFVLAAAGFCTGYYFIYVKRSTADFLIKTDGELAKVTWPRISPWFKTDTQVWGATYVVLIVVFALTLYVFGVDWVLQRLAQILFYAR